ncbi:hypothetical protein D3C72_1981560 [compost metagenome]
MKCSGMLHIQLVDFMKKVLIGGEGNIEVYLFKEQVQLGRTDTTERLFLTV